MIKIIRGYVVIGWAVAVLALLIILGASPVLTAAASPDVIVNGDFETGDLSGWTVDGLGAHVEALQADNFNPNIPVPQGDYFALMSTGCETINASEGPDLDGNTYPENDTGTLSQVFTLSAGEVPATLTFRWSFLTSEYDEEPFDDLFMVTLNDTDILHGSAPGLTTSPFADVPTLDGVGYEVISPGFTNGSIFFEGMCGFQTFSYPINTPGTYTLQFLVADQANHGYDSGLLIDKVTVTISNFIVGGTVVAENKADIIVPWLWLAGLTVLATGSWLVMRRRATR
jgi:hypothetical protein